MVLLLHVGLDPPSVISLLLRVGAALAYSAIGAIVLLQVRRSVASALLAAACAATACDALLSGAFWTEMVVTGSDLLDLCRAAAWFTFVLYVSRCAPVARQRWWTIATLAIIVGASAATSVLLGLGDWHVVSPLLGLGLAIGQMLLLENLYRNATEETRWHIGLACIALGMMAGYDMVVRADTLLFNSHSDVLADSQWLVAILTSPLLGLALSRSREWSIDLHMSRAAAFHSATLVVSGVFLIAMAVTGELVRSLGLPASDRWSSLAELCLLFSGLLTLAVLLTSASARSGLGRLLLDHFFSHRFDYRREWLRCIDTLCAEADGERGNTDTALSLRAIKVISQIVDSPAGVLLLREPTEDAWRWASSWNMPVLTAPVLPGHPLWDVLGWTTEAAVLSAAVTKTPPLNALGPLWLGVPLRTTGHEDDPAFGCILVAPPRVPFQIDQEVLALLRVLGRETATHLSNQRAARTIAQTGELREYGRRFAFVAHDIKNVSGQLSLLLSNAEQHLDNPAFRTDMVATIAASVDRINGLLRRLDAANRSDTLPSFMVAERLESLTAEIGRSLGATIQFDVDGDGGRLDMDADVFDTAIGHLVINAVQAGREASSPAPVSVLLRREHGRLSVDITDRGRGMTPEFIRDTLFEPFRTTKPGGSGIGAFQARELLVAAGGELTVLSKPGLGTTMRVSLPTGIAKASVRRPVRATV
jgi:putative PEP-CTERM system histidine kinase